jgi:hypothetical protein
MIEQDSNFLPPVPPSPPRPVYRTTWRNKWLTSSAKSIHEMVELLRSAAADLEAMANDGVMLDAEGGSIQDDYAQLITEDPIIAKKYSFEAEQDDEEEGDEAEKDEG